MRLRRCGKSILPGGKKDGSSHGKNHSVVHLVLTYKVPLRDVVDLESQGCCKLERERQKAASSGVPIYSECCNIYCLLCGGTRFDGV